MFNKNSNDMDVIKPTIPDEQIEVLDEPVIEKKEIKEKSSNKLVIWAIVITIIVILLGGFIIYDKFLGNNNVVLDNKVNDANNENEEEQNEEKGFVEKRLVVYKSIKNEYSIIKDSYHNEKGFEIEAYSDEAELLDVNNNSGYLLYKDKDIILYNISSKESEKLDINNSYKHYKMIESFDNKKIIGIYYSDVNSQNEDIKNAVLYNLETNKEMYKGKYDTFANVNNDNYLVAKKCSSSKNDCEFILLRKDKEEAILNNTGSLINYEIKVDENGNVLFYVMSNGLTIKSTKVTIYSKEKDELFSNIEKNRYSFDKKYLYMVNNNIITKYDKNMKILETYNDFKEVKQLINNYAIVVNMDNELVIRDLISDTSTKLMDYKKEYTYVWELSNYYDLKDLENNTSLQPSKGKEAGIYIIVKTSQDVYGKSIQIYFNNKTKEVKTYDINNSSLGL